MRIFLAGGAGAIGRQLVPALVAHGDDVVATTRSPERAQALTSAGAEPVVVDVYDLPALTDAVAAAGPEVVIHQLTDLSSGDSVRNAELRHRGTSNLVQAARAAGVDRMVAQSISWAYAPGSTPAVEDDPLDLDAPEPRRSGIEAVHALETAVLAMPHGVVLRYGTLYGPGTWYARDGRFGEIARDRRLPSEPATTCFLHVGDAALAAVDALDWPGGVVNIVDDEPARGTEWTPAFARAVGAPLPQSHDDVGTGRAVSNAKAKGLGWVPLHPSWRDGFKTL